VIREALPWLHDRDAAVTLAGATMAGMQIYEPAWTARSRAKLERSSYEQRR